MLLSIPGGSDLGLFEINEAARLVQEAAHPEANIIFGAVIDDALGDEVRVTVIAAGFDGGGPVKRGSSEDRGLGAVQNARPATNGAATNGVPRQPGRVTVPRFSRPRGAGAGSGRGSGRFGRAPPRRRPGPPLSRSSGRRTRSRFDDADDLDVPDFLK